MIPLPYTACDDGFSYRKAQAIIVQTPKQDDISINWVIGFLKAALLPNLNIYPP